MAYETVCPKGHRLQITRAHFGQSVDCPTCGEPFVVPDTSGEKPAEGSPGALGGSSAAGRSSGPGRLMPLARRAGHPMLAVGLVLVLFSRGCDVIGNRSVDRAKTKAKIAASRFDGQWEDKQARARLRIIDIEKRQEDERNKDEPDYDLISQWSKDIEAIQKEVAKFAEDQKKARELLELGKWRELNNAARDADANNKINAYWRAVFFVFATVVLALGLLAVSWTSDGAERWVCLIMLAIITFSIYIVGVAWIGLPI